MSRIANLPTRDWRTDADKHAEGLTKILRTPQGTMALRPIQGAALWEMYTVGGLFGSIRAGGGKTIISGLAFNVLDAKRGLLLVPASLVKKTKREFKELRLHWQVPHNITILSFEKLGRDKYSDYLLRHRFDVIVCDEAHKLKNMKSAACAKRVGYYMLQHPETKCVMLSGTVSKDSIKDYAHYLTWALKEGAPVPQTANVIDMWASALDVGVNAWDRADFKILWPHIGKCSNIDEAREAYRDRLSSTPGVIISTEGYSESRLVIAHKRLVMPEGHEEMWRDLRERWLNADGYPLGDSKAQVWEAAQTYALGFYRIHDPWPPEPWMKARKEWCAYAREIIEASPGLYDTEFQVRQACEQGELKSVAYDLWAKMEPTFKIHRKIQWFSDHALNAVQKFVEAKLLSAKGGCIIWCGFPEFARRLSDRSGWDYYGSGGICKRTGQMIEDADGKEVIIASIEANYTGRNLQQFHRGVVLPWPAGGPKNEQMLARMHRDLQESDVVEFYNFVGCKENITTLEKAIMEANYIVSTTGLPQRILDAEIIMPDWKMKGVEYE